MDTKILRMPFVGAVSQVITQCSPSPPTTPNFTALELLADLASQQPQPPSPPASVAGSNITLPQEDLELAQVNQFEERRLCSPSSTIAAHDDDYQQLSQFKETGFGLLLRAACHVEMREQKVMVEEKWRLKSKAQGNAKEERRSAVKAKRGKKGVQTKKKVVAAPKARQKKAAPKTVTNKKCVERKKERDVASTAAPTTEQTELSRGLRKKMPSSRLPKDDERAENTRNSSPKTKKSAKKRSPLETMEE